VLLGCPAGSAPEFSSFQCKAMVETGGLNVNRIAANASDTLRLG
jgi:hypothetical protein